MNDYTKKIMDACNSGEINPYMGKKLLQSAEFGMTDYLLDCAIDDAKDASKSEVNSDEDYNLRFFILNIADDMLDDTFDTKVTPEEKNHLCKYMMVNKNKCKLDDLTDFRVLMHKWLCDKHSKKAYPNTFGKENRDPTYDRYKWINTIKVIYSLLKEKGINKDAAIELATTDWSSEERFKFTNWLRYYESGNTEKYNVKTATKKQAVTDIDDLGLPAHMIDPATRSNNVNERPMSAYKMRKEKTRKEQDLENAKAFKGKMKSRLRSLRRLLDKYNGVLPHQNIEQIQDEMYALDKSISKLNVHASMQDCMARSANRIRRMGFPEGADFLQKVAQDPPEKAPPLPAPPKEKDDSAVVESLPAPEPSQPSSPDVNLSMVLERLEGLTKMLKSRDLIRDMASADILLNELGLASYFPELGDSQSKLIEAFSYASNRVEAIVSKLRGTGKSMSKAPSIPGPKPGSIPGPKPGGEPEVPPISTEQLRSKPVGPVQRKLPTG
jgi:hypothetical protein